MRRIAAVTMVVLGVLVCAAPGAQALSVGHRGEVTGDLKAGKALGIRIPESILVRADEVIQ